MYIDLIKVSLLLPGLVFWIKNYKFAALPTDPTFIPALLTILACFSENMQHEFNIPRKNSKFSPQKFYRKKYTHTIVILNTEKTWNSVILCSIHWFILYYKCSPRAIRDSYRYLDSKSKESAHFTGCKSRDIRFYKDLQ